MSKVVCCGFVHLEQGGGVCHDCPDIKPRVPPKRPESMFDDHHADISFGTAHRPDLYSGQKPDEFWKGKFGDAYHKRQETTIEARRDMYFRAIPRDVKTLLEFGAGTGDNLRAVEGFVPDRYATEINAEARAEIPVGINVWAQPIQEFHTHLRFDLTMTRGLLIHIPPKDLPLAYAALYDHSDRYILIAEYYSPSPRMIPYRGENDKLWARDFAGEMMAKYPDLVLQDYGFVYHKDPEYPQDDITWFLLEKAGP